MDYCAEIYLNYKPIAIDTLFGQVEETGEQMDLLLGDAPVLNPTTLAEVSLNKLTPYAAEDADVTWQLSEVMRPLAKEADLNRVLDEIENPLLPVLADVEAH